MTVNFIMRSALLVAVTGGSVSCSMFWQVPTTPLHEAALNGDVVAITTLLKGGAGVDDADDMGTTALHWAARGGHPLGPHRCAGEDAARAAVISTLLELGADPNVQDRRPKGFGRSSGWTPLLVALHHEQFRSAAVLLEHGADPNLLSDQGLSAMAMAAQEGAPRALVALLVEKGFDPQKTYRRSD